MDKTHKKLKPIQRFGLFIILLIMPFLLIGQLIIDIVVILNNTIWNVYFDFCYELSTTFSYAWRMTKEAFKAILGLKSEIKPVEDKTDENNC